MCGRITKRGMIIVLVDCMLMLKLICLFKLGLSHSMCIASLIFYVNSVDAVSIIEKHESLHLFLHVIFLLMC